MSDHEKHDPPHVDGGAEHNTYVTTYGVLIHASPFAKAECSQWRADAATARHPHRACEFTVRSTQKTAHEELFSLMRTLILHFEQFRNNGRRVRSMVRRVAKTISEASVQSVAQLQMGALPAQQVYRAPGTARRCACAWPGCASQYLLLTLTD